MPYRRGIAGSSTTARRATCGRSRPRAFAQVRPTNYDARVGGSRFLEVDPIPGGSANNYDYVNGDPVNGSDLDGSRACTSTVKFTMLGHLLGFIRSTAAEVRLTVRYNTPGRQACSNTHGATGVRGSISSFCEPHT